MAPERVQFCTFYLGELLFGVEVRHVREVLREQRVTRVPLAHPTVSGLINLRGHIIAAIDLRRRLQLDSRTSQPGCVNIIVKVDQSTVSFLVDAVAEVEEMQNGSFEPLPETLEGIARVLVKGVYQLPKQLLLILNPEKVLDLQTT
jgi:purine-binding chemotaxis protein CheW